MKSIDEIKHQIALNNYDQKRESPSSKLFSSPRIQNAFNEDTKESENLLKAAGIVCYSKET